MSDRLRRLFRFVGARKPEPPGAASAPPPQAPPAAPAKEGAATYLKRVEAKIDTLAADFAAGTINRAQFQELYGHYQRERQAIERLIDAQDEGWASKVSEGQSIVIRQRHLARAEGYAIYENESGMPVALLGRFEIDPTLIVPMLSSYRAATQEIFGAGMKSTSIEGGRWLSFVPGRRTTMIAIFSQEPAEKQREYLEGLHRFFEQANARSLETPPVDPQGLIFPHEYFLGMWKKA